jgi:cyanophycinase-like exopeptidase
MGLVKKKLARAAKKQMLSTSQARANFAEALGMAHEENTVIGFDRYGKLVAAVVPIDAVRMLAGRSNEVEPAVRSKIERMSRIFLHAAPQEVEAVSQEAAQFEPKPKERRKRKHKREKKKRAKAARAKRNRRISRKI